MRILVFLGLFCSLYVSGLEFKDAKGRMDRIPAHLIDVFYETEKGHDLKEDVKVGQLIDFSGTRPCLKAEYIKRVLEYAQDLDRLTKKEVTPDETYLLDTANYLGVKQKELFYHLANRVWGYLRTGMQRKDLQLSESDEAYVRKIAKPYLHNPARIIEKDHSKIMHRFKILPYSSSYSIDLSFDKATDLYPLASLEGLQDLVVYSGEVPSSLGTRFRFPYHKELNLSGNSLNEFVINLKIKASDLDDGTGCFQSICLTNNAITRIAWEGTVLPLPLEFLEIDLRGNPIQIIDNSIYQLAYYYRCQGKRFRIIMPDHKLSLQEIALAKQQWYLAVNTLVDRYSKSHNPDGIGVLAALLVTLGAGVADYAVQSNGIVLLVGGLGGGLVSWLTLHMRYLPRLAYYMAKKTHPDIEKPQPSFHEPLGNTWLEDWKKPQLVLGDEQK